LKARKAVPFPQPWWVSISLKVQNSSGNTITDASGSVSAVSLPVQILKGVGPRLAQRLAGLGLYTLADLLFHLPFRYQDRSQQLALDELQSGAEAAVVATVVDAEVIQRQRRYLLVRIADANGGLNLRFFHFGQGQLAQLQPGVRLYCYGEVRQGPAGLEMIHPEYRCLVDDEPPPTAEHLTPIYPTTEGLSQFQLRSLVDQALAHLSVAGERALADHLPEALRERQTLPGLVAALTLLHHPPVAEAALLETGRHPARRRLVFEELLAHHLSLRQLRQRRQRHRAPVLEGDGTLRQRFQASLPFALTAAQRRVIHEIDADLGKSTPMLRLVQGDVGSGKTVVAAHAVLRAVEAGCQAAVMAPTELLSEQHYRNFRAWLEPLEVQATWLVGRLGKRAREAALGAIGAGEARVVVGTHALFQEGVDFAALGLVVIDEQHRFGVHQRLTLRDKGRSPHQLVMTATPIPRTLAMSVYADLDTSVIDELPPGRLPVTTVAVSGQRRGEVVERVRAACRAGRQAYWVCPLIEESETLECQAATELARQLHEILPELRVGLVHGRLKAADKAATMDAFQSGAIQLLVATTVIEVGVDVPNASLMIIDNAERLGLSQLHQLRGRVGRSDTESHCVLLYRPPLSEQARSRLGVLRDSHDGFAIARRDMELRGPGEVLGTRQTGSLGMRIADLLRDEDLLPVVQAEAETLLREHPGAVGGLIQRWIGDGGRYGEV